MLQATKLLALFTCGVSLVMYVNALPGTFIAKDAFTNTDLPYTRFKNYTRDEMDCRIDCIESPTCEAYAVSYYNEEKCIQYDVPIGFDMPDDNTYNFYTRKREEDDGYFLIGQKYIELHPYMKTYQDASEICETESGSIVVDDNEAVHRHLVDIMAKRIMYRIWLGISDVREEGVWTDGHGKHHTDSPYWMHHGKWYSVVKNCAIMFYGEEPGWRHEDCGGAHYFFCEIPVFK